MPRKKLPPIAPGDVLLEEFLKPLGISQYQLAKDVGVPPRRVNEIVLGKRGVAAGTALRLARYFGTSDPGVALAANPTNISARPGGRGGVLRFWPNLEARDDLEAAKDRLGARLRKEVRVLAEKPQAR